MSSGVRRYDWRAISGFLIFSHGLTWTFWLIAVLRGVDVWSSRFSTVLLVLGGLGVPVGGIVMTWAIAGGPGLRDLARRTLDPRAVRGWWWAVIVLLYPTIKLIAAAVDGAIGGSGVVADPSVSLHPLRLLPLAALVLVLGPLPEEIGWRGYLLDRFNERMAPLGAGLLLGLLWLAWHLPLFWMPGYFERAGGPPEPMVWGATLMLTSVLITWVYVNNARSVFAAIVLHYTDNLSGELLDLSQRARLLALLLLAGVVGLIVLKRGFTLTRQHITPAAGAGPRV